MGRAPTLALCSRNARPEKGLVRRPHLDQRACPSQREKTSELGRIILVDHGARQGEERVLARWGWRVRRLAFLSILQRIRLLFQTCRPLKRSLAEGVEIQICSTMPACLFSPWIPSLAC